MHNISNLNNAKKIFLLGESLCTYQFFIISHHTCNVVSRLLDLLEHEHCKRSGNLHGDELSHSAEY